MRYLISTRIAGSISVFVSLCLTILMGMEPEEPIQVISPEYPFLDPMHRIGQFPFPTNPLNDRAKGYLLKGKVKSAVGNFGNFIEWLNHPAGLWGDYTYLPRVAFVAGVPGHKYSYHYDWKLFQTKSQGIAIWFSTEGANDWYTLDNKEKFTGVIFNAKNDGGNVGELVQNIDQMNNVSQWFIKDDSLFISLPFSSNIVANPNIANVYGINDDKKGVGLIYPWALRPKLVKRNEDFDFYDYGDDEEEWTIDDNYDYYGSTVSESWFTRFDPKWNSDWQPVTLSRINSHNVELNAGDIFGDTPFTDSSDPYPLLAHSAYSETWPIKITDLGAEHFWPGWWAEDYIEGRQGCSGSRKDSDCWQEVPGRHISDNDVYMEFDDRWAHRGNQVSMSTGPEGEDEYKQTSYPLGLRVMAEAHSYGVSFAEDILFVTVKVRNESGDWCAYERNANLEEIPVRDEDGNQLCGGAMIMPDGTKLNRGDGFDYEQVNLGFYMDADVVTLDAYGNYFHTSDDDFMEYYLERFSTYNDSMLISMAMVYDFDGNSAGATDIGIVAAQLLDTPLSTDAIDLDKNGSIDVWPGEPLKMTDWHWFDWSNRPGVVNRESDNSCHAGEPGCEQAHNKEEIQYKLMAGDTTNLSDKERTWFFHTSNPALDLDSDLNPHFDSLEGLKSEEVFLEGEEGLDCVLLFSCGPFDLKVGEEVPFSFCIIFGENRTDLINNARFAQIMYNSHYQSYTPPSIPYVTAIADHNKVTLFWDDIAERSIDAVTGYSDFEGYKIYKSMDKGITWGGPEDKIYGENGLHVGWKPLKQYDLTAEEDSLFCVYGFNQDGSCSQNINCSKSDCRRNKSISGEDPLAEWFSLGHDSGFSSILNDTIIDERPFNYSYTDTNVTDGIEYTYSVTVYDMGIEPIFHIMWSDSNNGFVNDTVYNVTNPLGWSAPNGYSSIESSKGTTIHDPNFITVTPGYRASDDYALSDIRVVPNPYLIQSGFNETKYMRRMRFTKLPSKCTITIFTITGEIITNIVHENNLDSNEWWNLRTVNNQEVGPGLYLYAVESEKEKHIGKFVVAR